MKKQFILLIIATFLFAPSLFGQTKNAEFYLPVFGIKTNVLYGATLTPNLGVEVALSRKLTIDVSGNYNPWTFSDGKKFKHWMVQPELRYWLCERFGGHFFGIHGFVGEFDAGGIEALDLDGKRYKGDGFGGGISYGYHWILGKRWSLEGTIGVGYARFDYKKYVGDNYDIQVQDTDKNYFGPTKIGLSIIYFFK